MNEEKRRELEQKKQVIHGEGRSGKQHDSGKLTAWERILVIYYVDIFVDTVIFL